MKTIRTISFHSDSREELLPDFAGNFPYLSSRAEIDKHPGRVVPWHWHSAIELFYMENGTLEYSTPGERISFPPGSGGMVNSNVLHMTRAKEQHGETIQFLHIFDSSLISGEAGSLIDKMYVAPIVSSPQIEIVPLFPEHPDQIALLRKIQDAFQLSASEYGYELRLRNALSEIWLLLSAQIRSKPTNAECQHTDSQKIKAMMIYIQEHYSEKITVQTLADAAFLSERDCYRVFHDSLHTTPQAYLNDYRMRIACRMLAAGQEPITDIGYACGFGNSSYFGKLFRKYAHCTPSAYRKKQQNRDK